MNFTLLFLITSCCCPLIWGLSMDERVRQTAFTPLSILRVSKNIPVDTLTNSTLWELSINITQISETYFRQLFSIDEENEQRMKEMTINKISEETGISKARLIQISPYMLAEIDFNDPEELNHAYFVDVEVVLQYVPFSSYSDYFDIMPNDYTIPVAKLFEKYLGMSETELHLLLFNIDEILLNNSINGILSQGIFDTSLPFFEINRRYDNKTPTIWQLAYTPFSILRVTRNIGTDKILNTNLWDLSLLITDVDAAKFKNTLMINSQTETRMKSLTVLEFSEQSNVSLAKVMQLSPYRMVSIDLNDQNAMEYINYAYDEDIKSVIEYIPMKDYPYFFEIPNDKYSVPIADLFHEYLGLGREKLWFLLPNIYEILLSNSIKDLEDKAIFDEELPFFEINRTYKPDGQELLNLAYTPLSILRVTHNITKSNIQNQSLWDLSFGVLNIHTDKFRTFFEIDNETETRMKSLTILEFSETLNVSLARITQLSLYRMASIDPYDQNAMEHLNDAYDDDIKRVLEYVPVENYTLFFEIPYDKYSVPISDLFHEYLGLKNDELLRFLPNIYEVLLTNSMMDLEEKAIFDATKPFFEINRTYKPDGQKLWELAYTPLSVLRVTRNIPHHEIVSANLWELFLRITNVGSDKFRNVFMIDNITETRMRALSLMNISQITNVSMTQVMHLSPYRLSIIDPHDSNILEILNDAYIADILNFLKHVPLKDFLYYLDIPAEKHNVSIADLFKKYLGMTKEELSSLLPNIHEIILTSSFTDLYFNAAFKPELTFLEIDRTYKTDDQKLWGLAYTPLSIIRANYNLSAGEIFSTDFWNLSLQVTKVNEDRLRKVFNFSNDAELQMKRSNLAVLQNRTSLSSQRLMQLSIFRIANIDSSVDDVTFVKYLNQAYYQDVGTLLKMVTLEQYTHIFDISLQQMQLPATQLMQQLIGIEDWEIKVILPHIYTDLSENSMARLISDGIFNPEHSLVEINTYKDCNHHVCTGQYEPVCGTGGQTYSNQCYFGIAQCLNSELKQRHRGECVDGEGDEESVYMPLKFLDYDFPPSAVFSKVVQLVTGEPIEKIHAKYHLISFEVFESIKMFTLAELAWCYDFDLRFASIDLIFSNILHYEDKILTPMTKNFRTVGIVKYVDHRDFLHVDENKTLASFCHNFEAAISKTALNPNIISNRLGISAEQLSNFYARFPGINKEFERYLKTIMKMDIHEAQSAVHEIQQHFYEFFESAMHSDSLNVTDDMTLVQSLQLYIEFSEDIVELLLKHYAGITDNVFNLIKTLPIKDLNQQSEKKEDAKASDADTTVIPAAENSTITLPANNGTVKKKSAYAFVIETVETLEVQHRSPLIKGQNLDSLAHKQFKDIYITDEITVEILSAYFSIDIKEMTAMLNQTIQEIADRHSTPSIRLSYANAHALINPVLFEPMTSSEAQKVINHAYHMYMYELFATLPFGDYGEVFNMTQADAESKTVVQLLELYLGLNLEYDRRLFSPTAFRIFNNKTAAEVIELGGKPEWNCHNIDYFINQRFSDESWDEQLSLKPLDPEVYELTLTQLIEKVNGPLYSKSLIDFFPLPEHELALYENTPIKDFSKCHHLSSMMNLQEMLSSVHYYSNMPLDLDYLESGHIFDEFVAYALGSFADHLPTSPYILYCNEYVHTFTEFYDANFWKIMSHSYHMTPAKVQEVYAEFNIETGMPRFMGKRTSGQIYNSMQLSDQMHVNITNRYDSLYMNTTDFDDIVEVYLGRKFNVSETLIRTFSEMAEKHSRLFTALSIRDMIHLTNSNNNISLGRLYDKVLQASNTMTEMAKTPVFSHMYTHQLNESEFASMTLWDLMLKVTDSDDAVLRILFWFESATETRLRTTTMDDISRKTDVPLNRVIQLNPYQLSKIVLDAHNVQAQILFFYIESLRVTLDQPFHMLLNVAGVSKHSTSTVYEVFTEKMGMQFQEMVPLMPYAFALFTEKSVAELSSGEYFDVTQTFEEINNFLRVATPKQASDFDLFLNAQFAAMHVICGMESYGAVLNTTVADLSQHCFNSSLDDFMQHADPVTREVVLKNRDQMILNLLGAEFVKLPQIPKDENYYLEILMGHYSMRQALTVSENFIALAEMSTVRNQTIWSLIYGGAGVPSAEKERLIMLSTGMRVIAPLLKTYTFQDIIDLGIVPETVVDNKVGMINYLVAWLDKSRAVFVTDSNIEHLCKIPIDRQIGEFASCAPSPYMEGIPHRLNVEDVVQLPVNSLPVGVYYYQFLTRVLVASVEIRRVQQAAKLPMVVLVRTAGLTLVGLEEENLVPVVAKMFNQSLTVDKIEKIFDLDNSIIQLGLVANFNALLMEMKNYGLETTFSQIISLPLIELFEGLKDLETIKQRFETVFPATVVYLNKLSYAELTFLYEIMWVDIHYGTLPNLENLFFGVDDNIFKQIYNLNDAQLDGLYARIIHDYTMLAQFIPDFEVNIFSSPHDTIHMALTFSMFEVQDVLLTRLEQINDSGLWDITLVDLVAKRANKTDFLDFVHRYTANYAVAGISSEEVAEVLSTVTIHEYIERWNETITEMIVMDAIRSLLLDNDAQKKQDTKMGVFHDSQIITLDCPNAYNHTLEKLFTDCLHINYTERVAEIADKEARNFFTENRVKSIYEMAAEGETFTKITEDVFKYLTLGELVIQQQHRSFINNIFNSFLQISDDRVDVMAKETIWQRWRADGTFVWVYERYLALGIGDRLFSQKLNSTTFKELAATYQITATELLNEPIWNIVRTFEKSVSKSGLQYLPFSQLKHLCLGLLSDHTMNDMVSQGCLDKGVIAGSIAHIPWNTLVEVLSKDPSLDVQKLSVDSVMVLADSIVQKMKDHTQMSLVYLLHMQNITAANMVDANITDILEVVFEKKYDKATLSMLLALQPLNGSLTQIAERTGITNVKQLYNLPLSVVLHIAYEPDYDVSYALHIVLPEYINGVVNTYNLMDVAQMYGYASVNEMLPSGMPIYTLTANLFGLDEYLFNVTFDVWRISHNNRFNTTITQSEFVQFFKKRTYKDIILLHNLTHKFPKILQKMVLGPDILEYFRAFSPFNIQDLLLSEIPAHLFDAETTLGEALHNNSFGVTGDELRDFLVLHFTSNPLSMTDATKIPEWVTGTNLPTFEGEFGKNLSDFRGHEVVTLFAQIITDMRADNILGRKPFIMWPPDISCGKQRDECTFEELMKGTLYTNTDFYFKKLNVDAKFYEKIKGATLATSKFMFPPQSNIMMMNLKMVIILMNAVFLKVDRTLNEPTMLHMFKREFMKYDEALNMKVDDFFAQKLKMSTQDMVKFFPEIISNEIATATVDLTFKGIADMKVMDDAMNPMLMTLHNALSVKLNPKDASQMMGDYQSVLTDLSMRKFTDVVDLFDISIPTTDTLEDFLYLLLRNGPRKFVDMADLGPIFGTFAFTEDQYKVVQRATLADIYWIAADSSVVETFRNMTEALKSRYTSALTLNLLEAAGNRIYLESHTLFEVLTKASSIQATSVIQSLEKSFIDIDQSQAAKVNKLLIFLSANTLGVTIPKLKVNESVLENKKSYLAVQDFLDVFEVCSTDSNYCKNLDEFSTCDLVDLVSQCKCNTGYVSAPLTKLCIGKCAAVKCQENSACFDIAVGATCRCVDGYTLSDGVCKPTKDLLKDDKSIVTISGVTLNEPFKEELKDKSSPEFIEMAAKIEKAFLEELRKKNPDIENIIVTGLKQGSIVIEMQVVMKKGADDPADVVSKSLNEAIQSGDTGLNVDKTKTPKVEVQGVCDVADCGENSYCLASADKKSFTCPCEVDYKKQDDGTCEKSDNAKLIIAIVVPVLLIVILILFIVLIPYVRRRYRYNAKETTSYQNPTYTNY